MINQKKLSTMQEQELDDRHLSGQFDEGQTEKMSDEDFIKTYLVKREYASFETLPFADALYSMARFVKNFDENFFPILNEDSGKISPLVKNGNIKGRYKLSKKDGVLSEINLEISGNKAAFCNWLNHKLLWSVSAKHDNSRIQSFRLGDKDLTDKWKSFWPQKFVTNSKWYNYFMKLDWGYEGRGKTAIHFAKLRMDMNRFEEFKADLFEEIERRCLFTWCIRNEREELARKADARMYDNYKKWINGKLVWTRVAEFFNEEPLFNPELVLRQKESIQQKIQLEQEFAEFERDLELQASAQKQILIRPQRIFILKKDGSVICQDRTEAADLSIKNSDPEFFLYEAPDGIITGISAPSLIKHLRKILIYADKHTIKSAGRIINNLIALAGYKQPFKLGSYYWKRLFPITNDLNQLGIPEPYHTTFIYRVTLSAGGQGRARWMKDFQNDFLIPLADWLKLSGLKNFNKTSVIQNPTTKAKYKKRFNDLSALLKFKAGLGEWKDEKWQGKYNQLFVLKYDPEHIFAVIKYVCESIQFTGDNRTGKNKRKLVEYFQEHETVKIVHSTPESRNFPFIITLSSRSKTLLDFYNNLSTNTLLGSKIVQAHLTSVIENCVPAAVDPWTVQQALNQKHLRKPPKNLKELLIEMKDGPINSFCAGLFVDPNFRDYCNKIHNLNLTTDSPLYPNSKSEHIITQSIRNHRLADTYGKSFTAASIPDVVTNYQKNIGSTEFLFIKVVSNDLLYSLEEDISEILKTNYNQNDPFRPFTAYVFLSSDLKSTPANLDKKREILLLLRKHNAIGLINIEIPDLCTIGLSRFGEIWASLKTEYITSKKYTNSRKKYLTDPMSFENQLIDKIIARINLFQKLNPVDRETVEKGMKLIDLTAPSRTEFILNTVMNYFKRIYP